LVLPLEVRVWINHMRRFICKVRKMAKKLMRKAAPTFLTR